MKVESTVTWGRWLTSLLAVAACLGIAGLLWFGYRATRAWQQSSDLLITVDTNNAADLLVSAVTRDMRSVQSRVLANRDWAESSVSSADTSIQVAIAFTRYPYPESFFTWKHSDSEVVFFNRVNRYPAWMPQAHQSSRLPVILVRDPLARARCVSASIHTAPRATDTSCSIRSSRDSPIKSLRALCTRIRSRRSRTRSLVLL